MLQLCIFGGYEGPLSAEKKCCFTVFGGCVLRRPTLARQIIAARRVREGALPVPKMIFLTVFGGTEIKYPTLAEEFIDLREAMRGGQIRTEDWDRCLAEVEQINSASMLSLTLFGSFSESELPTEDEEVEGLALQRHAGNLADSTSRILATGVGQRGSARHAVIRQAVQTA